MNLYAIRLIPSLKLKFCQFFGIASSLAFEQLIDRLSRIEGKMDRFENQLRRVRRQQMSLEAVQVRDVREKTKKPHPETKKANLKTKRKTAVSTRSTLKHVPVSDNVTPLAPVAAKKASGSKKSSPNKEAVILLEQDQEVRETVKGYLGKKTRMIPIDSIEDIDTVSQGMNVSAILFDRSLLGQPKMRQTLEEISEDSPHTQMVGISSYLTLPLARSIPGKEEFATFLTKPLSPEALGRVFENKGRQAIS